jgi:nicotinamide-nucleotide amidase
MFALTDIAEAERLLSRLRALKWTVCTAESCTGGLIVALLTEVPGSSDVVDRGFITYSNGAKCDCLGVPATLIGRFGAVSAEVGAAMASGAIRASTADLAVAVTGIAGPGGGSAQKPIGLVHLAAQIRGKAVTSIELRLGDIGRSEVRIATMREAVSLCHQALDIVEPGSVADGVP